MWSKYDEIKFLNKLGDYCKTPKIILLKRYLKTMNLRCDWGDINISNIKNECKRLIKKNEN